MPKKDADDKKAEQSAAEGSETESGRRTKKHIEDKLDDVAERFSKAMGEGVKRFEDVFDRGLKNLRQNPDFSRERITGFFKSSTGGATLLIIGIIWLFYTIGLLDKPMFPVIFIILGLYILYKSGKS